MHILPVTIPTFFVFPVMSKLRSPVSVAPYIFDRYSTKSSPPINLSRSLETINDYPCDLLFGHHPRSRELMGPKSLVSSGIHRNVTSALIFVNKLEAEFVRYYSNQRGFDIGPHSYHLSRHFTCQLRRIEKCKNLSLIDRGKALNSVAAILGQVHR